MGFVEYIGIAFYMIILTLAFRGYIEPRLPKEGDGRTSRVAIFISIFIISIVVITTGLLVFSLPLLYMVPVTAISSGISFAIKLPNQNRIMPP